MASIWRNLAAVGFAGALAAFSANPAAAGLEEVDVELVMAVDVSRSMAMGEQILQRKGYVDAIRSPEFLAAVQSGLLGKIALTYVEWGNAGEERVLIDWRIVEDETTAKAFADALADAPIRGETRTSISEAVIFSINQIDTNAYEGLRRVIDVSGDGPNDHGRPVTQARELAVARNVTINGLPIVLDEHGKRWSVVDDLERYYRNCVIGGAGSFQVPIRNRQDFAAAIRRKLVLEIVGVEPEETPLVMQAAAPGANDGGDLCTVGERATARR
ncbi:DUF1194 domain-containing protein [Amorphus coralli]|uniref:DUF1194 domain-containing protein n=1 Tax=Amorphus coralli TaxID=340680 RepID=UPI00036346F3|nr:DUF1194 domain-containing protein [Amorphus coralli]